MLSLTALIGAAVVAAAGCGGSQGITDRTVSPTVDTSGTSTVPLVRPTVSASSANHVQVTPAPIKLGVSSAVVDGTRVEVVTINGWTAYRFEKDSGDPSESTCYFDCVAAWPPAVTDGTKPQVTGIDPKLVGSVVRNDGYVQVTLGGWPLYRFAGDQSRSDTKGEGVSGLWSAIRPDGRPVIKKN
ncbi:hypothetical protein ACQPXM_11705 [Kribbella sp. CA-253562]|uniref:hypothetical protein n=1 Tax=Kribbella sp. CA-253562 TaxID=3239942 RepID=UPI003D8FAB2D